MTKYFFFLLLVFILTPVSASCQETQAIQQEIDNYISQAKLDSAKIYIKNQTAKQHKSEVKNALNYQLVKVLFMQSAYNEALTEAFYSLDTIDNEQEKVKFNFMIGVIYSVISDYDKSIEYFDLVIKNNQAPPLSVQTFLLLSNLHLSKNDSLNAGNSLTKAYKLTKTSTLDNKTKNHVAMQYSFYTKNYERCKELNLKAIRDTTSFLNTKSYAYSMLGDCLVKQDSLISATTYYDEFLKLTLETKDPEQIKVAASKLIEVYEKLGYQEKANAYHKIYNEAVNDSLSFSVEKYRDLYNIEKNRELKSVKTKNIVRTLLFGLIILLLFIIGVYHYKKLKKENNELFESFKRTPSKKISISDSEIAKIKAAISKLKKEQLFLKPNITRKSFCEESSIKSERYLSQFINENYQNSFSVFINNLRIEYAYNRILKDNKFRNYKVEEIAKESGFGSKKSFERAFLAKYNQTPFKLISNLKD
ncbi:helix-turn-helix domain-containing protein [Algibacter pacificus]|uniref:helix-turn-helix domain-containing protein n=1 Tax=Algibacter pacificus TaxID=2599389 RepID=UPI0011CBFB3D|nr:helix-turn-helix domain-containing protein [Algibacter pacificus]